MYHASTASGKCHRQRNHSNNRRDDSEYYLNRCDSDVDEMD